jgi:hypothetical protein
MQTIQHTYIIDMFFLQILPTIYINFLVILYRIVIYLANYWINNIYTTYSLCTEGYKVLYKILPYYCQYTYRIWITHVKKIIQNLYSLSYIWIT